MTSNDLKIRIRRPTLLRLQKRLPGLNNPQRIETLLNIEEAIPQSKLRVEAFDTKRDRALKDILLLLRRK